MQSMYPGYQPMFSAPYQPPRYPQPVQPVPTMQQAQEGMIRVTGVEGARAYPVQPNSRLALFDDTRDVFYVKTADSGGYPTLTAYTFTPLQDTTAPSPDYVTRAEFDELKEMIASGKQPVRKAKQPDPAE